MKETPIIFSTPMVQAILALIKRMTRRLTGLEEINEHPDDWELGDMSVGTDGNLWVIFWNKKTRQTKEIKCPYGKPGDWLWVRENFMLESMFPNAKSLATCKVRPVFQADKQLHVAKLIKWKPSIHLKKEDARLWLEIVNIRVERLQDISEEDAKSEGVAPEGECYKKSFYLLWKIIHDDKSWDSNPGCGYLNLKS